MNFPLLRFFKREKAATIAPAIAAGPRPVFEKPASERFGKTVMPNSARVMEPDSKVLAPAALKSFSSGHQRAPQTAPREIALSAPAVERTIAWQLSELLPQIPAELLEKAEVDPEHRIILKAAELERGMASGRPAVLLRSIYQQAPTIFTKEVSATDAREITLPFQKVLEQFCSLQVRVDQEVNAVVPQVETPFLQVTIEDGKKFGTSAPAAAPPPKISPAVATMPAPAPPLEVKPIAAPKPAPVVAPALIPPPPVKASAAAPAAPASKIEPRAPIRLSIPPSASATPAPAAPALIPPAPTAIKMPIAPKISPNGAGVPITERVPASSGSPAPTSLPAPFAPVIAAAPARIAFKITPPASDLCPPPVLPLRRTGGAPLAFSEEGARIRLPLRAVLRGILPFQLTGPVDQVPEEARIELPFAIIEPQLSLGRVAISPAQFQAAMPEEFRALYKLDEGGIPVSLPLPEILQNLPNETLQLRGDQEEIEVTHVFETPFSLKAAEDAARLKGASGPVIAGGAAVAVVAGIDDPGRPKSKSPAPLVPTTAQISLSSASPSPGLPIPARTAPSERNALQIALDTDDTLDAKSIVAHTSRLPGVSACAIVFSDGLSLAGNIPAEYQAEALCAIAPEIVKRIDGQMSGANLGALHGVTVFCAKAPVSFFAHGNICLAALHSAGEIAAEIRDRLGRITQEVAQIYAQPA